MAKFEFILESNPIIKSVRYWTEKDGKYVDHSIHHDRDVAYTRFINATCGIDTTPKKEVVETIYTLID